MKKSKKIMIWAIVVVVLSLLIWFIGRPYFVFGKGVKGGTLNFVVHKGYIFKTYEGKLIQPGFYSENGGVKSNEFIFSVAKKEHAELLMRASNKKVELHYKEYLGVLPWRGNSRYVVDSIVSISEDNSQTLLPIETN